MPTSVMQTVAAQPNGRPRIGIAKDESKPAIPTVRRATAPRATGLSVRPATRSRSASSQSFTQPTASWVAATAANTPRIRQPRWPTPMASSVIASVTAAPGSGWDDLSRATERDIDAVWWL
jgi:hypothetical protein